MIWVYVRSWKGFYWFTAISEIFFTSMKSIWYPITKSVLSRGYLQIYSLRVGSLNHVFVIMNSCSSAYKRSKFPLSFLSPSPYDAKMSPTQSLPNFCGKISHNYCYIIVLAWSISSICTWLGDKILVLPHHALLVHILELNSCWLVLIWATIT